jgi:hypothetical protein
VGHSGAEAIDSRTLTDHRVLVFGDIEGAERDLAGMDIIVESHECLVPGITAELQRRFAATHDVVAMHDDGQRQLHDPPEWFRALAHLDQLLAVWEWRSEATPWLVMRARGLQTEFAV